MFQPVETKRSSEVMRRTAFLFAALLVLNLSAQAADLLWMEGENPASTNNLAFNPGMNNINPFALSGGAWLSSFTEKGLPVTGSASYNFEIVHAGNYRFWLRGAGTAIEYQLDGGAWVAVDTKKGIDRCPAAANGNVGWPPSLMWFDLGNLDLAAGKHTLTFSLGGRAGTGGRFAAIDCFVLTTAAFTPDGKYKPGDKVPEAVTDFPADKSWAFTPGTDTLDSAAVLDLRYLNETTAGEHGFIRLSKDGNSFVRGDGAPIRFWGGCEYAQRKLDLEQLKRHAKFLAKRGVNIVRVHAIVCSQDENSQVTDVNEKEIDEIQKLVVAMKSAGIYTVISPYWGTAAKIKKNWGALGKVGASAEPLLFIDPALQKGYKAWVKAIYDRPNPYSETKTRLADEPAVAIIQFQNENSLLFWTLRSISDEAKLHLRQLYADFLKAKYGTLEKARAAWLDYNPGPGEIWIPHEWGKGLPGLVDPWDLTRDAMAKKGKWPGFIPCSADQLEFLCKTMYQFNSDIVKYLRHDLGCKQLINSGNWRGVDSVLTQDAEYWSDTAGDVLAKNIYTGGLHIGVNDGWQILPGHFYSDISMIREPVKLPVNIKQPVGHPFIIPETLWVPPNLYQSEGPLMVAAQSALTGLDIAFWFCSGSAEWDVGNGMGKWSYNTPMLLGQFPAAALIFRQGLVAEGKPAVVEQRSLQNIWERKMPIVSEESGWDPNRDSTANALTSTVSTAVDPLAHLVGPVRVVLGGDPAKTTVADLGQYIDREHKTVRSITGESETHYGIGFYRVNSPMAQAVSGFLGEAGPQQLRDVAITCHNRYATIVVVPLDDKPIRESGKVLIQVGTLSRPTGWTSRADRLFIDKTPTDCRRIVSTGKAPWLVENIDATVTVANPRLTRATLLDVNGMATPQAVKERQADGRITVLLPPNTLYLVLSASAAAPTP
jgi:hypothetical protein